jgi:hypothetical protein
MKTGKYINILVIIALCVFPLSSRYVPEKISFADLAANPEYYNEKYITIEGYCYFNLEELTITENLEDYPAIKGKMLSKGTRIWLEGDELEEIMAKVYTKYFYYPKIALTGVLHYGERYGHCGFYSYLLTICDYTWLE